MVHCWWRYSGSLLVEVQWFIAGGGTVAHCLLVEVQWFIASGGCFLRQGLAKSTPAHR